MKYRTDFVTNSSSDSFITVRIRLRSGEELKTEFDETGDYPVDHQDLVGAATIEELLQKMTGLINALIKAHEHNADYPENPYYLSRDQLTGALAQKARTIGDVDTIVWQFEEVFYGSELALVLIPIEEMRLEVISEDDPGYRAEFERVKAEVLKIEGYSALAEAVVNERVAAALATGDLWELLPDQDGVIFRKKTIIELASGKVSTSSELIAYS